MKTNFERAERIKASTQKIKLLASATKTFKDTGKEEENEVDLKKIIGGNTKDDIEDPKDDDKDMQEKNRDEVEEGNENEDCSDDELSDID